MTNISKAKKGRNYKEFYTSEMIELVNQKCSRELKMFGYTFDGPVDQVGLMVKPKFKYLIAEDKVVD